MNLVERLHIPRTGSLNGAMCLSVAAHLAALYFASQWTIHLVVENAALPPLRITEIIIEKPAEKSLDAPESPTITEMANPAQTSNPPKAFPREITPEPTKAYDPAQPTESQIEIKQPPVVVASAESSATTDPAHQPAPQPGNPLDAAKVIDSAPVIQTASVADAAPSVTPSENRAPTIPAPVSIAAKANTPEFSIKEFSIVPAPAPVISEVGSTPTPAPIVTVAATPRQASDARPAPGAITPHTVFPSFNAKPAAIVVAAHQPLSLESAGTIAPRQLGVIPTELIKDPIVAAIPKNTDGNAKSDKRPPAPTPAALPGANDSGDSDGPTARIKAGFVRQIREKIAVTRQYPRIARERGYEGQPVVNFTLGREGDLLAISIEQPSRHSLLDQAAIQTIKDAVPFPRIPEQLKSDNMVFKLPIIFRLE